MISTQTGTQVSAPRREAVRNLVATKRFPRPGLQELAPSLPEELITYILEIAAQSASIGTSSNRAKLNFLLLSRYYQEKLSPHVYSTVSLSSSSAIYAFAKLVKGSTRIARYVVRLWIGPADSSSDLLKVLSPPVHLEAHYIADMRCHVHEAARTILRSCRKLYDVALAGELLSLKSAHMYGSACQPIRLTSVNPYSFVGGFSAPIFRKVKVLRIVDTNLAFEETDEIRTLADLEWLIWTAPRDYGDSRRDLTVLNRLLRRPKRHVDPPPDGDAQDGSASPELPSLPSLTNDLTALEMEAGLGPTRPSKNDRFQRLTIQTSYDRCCNFRTRLIESSSFNVDSHNCFSKSSSGTEPDGLMAGLHESLDRKDVTWNSDVQTPIIHPTPLASTVSDEWNDLRDFLSDDRAGYSYEVAGDEEGHSVLAGADNSLRRQKEIWEQFREFAPPC